MVPAKAESVVRRIVNNKRPLVWATKEKRNKRSMAKNKKNRSGQSDSEEVYERDDRMQLHGVVEDALPGTLFKVITDGKVVILATLSGKLRQNNIRILPGDHVTVEVSPYDPSRGRLVWRK